MRIKHAITALIIGALASCGVASVSTAAPEPEKIERLATWLGDGSIVVLTDKHSSECGGYASYKAAPNGTTVQGCWGMDEKNYLIQAWYADKTFLTFDKNSFTEVKNYGTD